MTVAVLSKPSLVSTFSKEESACWTSGHWQPYQCPHSSFSCYASCGHVEMVRSSPCFACHLPVLHIGATGRHLHASQMERECPSPVVLRLAVLGIVDPPAHLLAHVRPTAGKEAMWCRGRRNWDSTPVTEFLLFALGKTDAFTLGLAVTCWDPGSERTMACISCSCVKLLPLREWMKNTFGPSWVICVLHTVLLILLHAQPSGLGAQKGHALSVKTALVLIFSY